MSDIYDIYIVAAYLICFGVLLVICVASLRDFYHSIRLVETLEDERESTS